MASSYDVSNDFGVRKQRWVVDFSRLTRIFFKNRMFCIKKCFDENDMFELVVRENIFCAPPDATDGFEEVVWDQGYPQNQTG